MLPILLPLIPKHSIYIEPYCGGASLFWAKEKVATEILNDTNGFVTNFYIQLISNYDQLQQKIFATPYSRAMYKYAMCVYELPIMFTSLQKAHAFYILVNAGFSGRIGSFGCYTTGRNAHTWENRKQLFNKDLIERIRATQIECTNATKLLKLRSHSSAFAYCDPPYFNSNCGHYGGFTENDFKELLDVLSEFKGKFILSSYPSPILSDYVKEFGWEQKETIQNVTANRTKSSKNRQKVEVLTANYPINNTIKS